MSDAPRPKDIQKRAVMVDGGSGVWLPALTNEYAYVLTACHNLRVNRDTPEILRAPEEIVITFHDGSTCSAIQIVPSVICDAAVLLVPRIDVDPVAVSPAVRMRDPVWLVGYPDTRRDDGLDPTRVYRGEVESFDEFEIDISTASFAHVDEVRGASGAGLYKLVDDKWVLIGIEYGMESRPAEGHNWLRCSPIPVFEQLLRENALAPMLPPFLLSFDGLVSAAFPLPGLECARTHGLLQKILHHVACAKLGVNCPAPHEVLEKFGEQLLVFGEPRYNLTDKKLWISWLELLVLSALLDQPARIDGAYMDGLRKRRRLLYSGSSREWTDFIEHILCSNFEGLDADGLVLVSNNRESPPIKTSPIRDLSKIIPDIALPLDSALDIGISRKPAMPRKLMHLDGLHMDCIVRREDEYAAELGQDFSTTLNLLIEAYRAAFAQ